MKLDLDGNFEPKPKENRVYETIGWIVLKILLICTIIKYFGAISSISRKILPLLLNAIQITIIDNKIWWLCWLKDKSLSYSLKKMFRNTSPWLSGLSTFQNLPRKWFFYKLESFFQFWLWVIKRKHPYLALLLKYEILQPWIYNQRFL